MLRQAGGLVGGNQIFANASQFGDGQAFIGDIANASGSFKNGLVDPTATSHLGGFIAQSLTSGLGDVNGRYAAQGAMSMVGQLSNSVGDNILNSRQFIQGSAAYNNDISRGGLDPLQQAINHHASFGLGGTMYGRLKLERMSPIELLHIVRGANDPKFTMPRSLSAEGVSKQDVLSFANNQAQGTFARYSRAMGGDSEVARAVEQARSMGINPLLNKYKAEGRLGEGFDLLASGLEDASGGKYDHQTARGMLMQIAARDKNLAPSLTGGHLGVGTGNTQEQALKDTATKDDQKRMAEVRDKIVWVDETMRKASTTSDSLLKITTDLNKAGKDFVTAMTNASRVINEKLLPALNKIGQKH